VPSTPRGDRYAAPVITNDGRWAICVHERHGADGIVDNDLVAVPLDALSGEAEPVVLTSGHDFYSSPAISPDGARLAWISWDHPHMPWDSTELWLASLQAEVTEVSPITLGRKPRLVAGGAGVSVTQPRFSPEGVLHWVSDETGWWNIYDESHSALCPLDAEFAGPDWVFGNRDYGFGEDGSLIAAWSGGGHSLLGTVKEECASPLDLAYSDFASVTTVGSDILAVAASPIMPPAVVRIDPVSGRSTVLRASRQVTLDTEDISVPRHIEFPSGDGSSAHALFYEPRNSSYSGPVGELPPLVVMIHGGPTGNAAAVFNPRVQFWTSRGFAVADVDHRGSHGYGRGYRNQLARRWGVVDVEDCAAVVSWLAGQRLIDGRRAVIRGGSAGGFTTLAALAFTDAFAAGASHFGIGDLELLARDTHKFESRYLDGLIGPWPQEADEYRRRSPIHHIDSIDAPLVLFHGLEDKVVPPEQSQLTFDSLRDRGIPVALLTFAGEQHGFRKADTIIAVMAVELAFYGRVLGFEPDPAGMEAASALEIANAEKLSPRG
jgi:dipeptidyl aminopeptidase/acylaminoacyl peptidase